MSGCWWNIQVQQWNSLSPQSVVTVTMPIINTKIELNKELKLVTSATSGSSLERARQEGLHCLPGQARTSLNNAPLQKYLREALLAPNLNKIAVYLWLVRMINVLMNRGHTLTIAQGGHARPWPHLPSPLPSGPRPQRYRYRKCLPSPRMAL